MVKGLQMTGNCLSETTSSNEDTYFNPLQTVFHLVFQYQEKGTLLMSPQNSLHLFFKNKKKYIFF